MLLTTAKKVAVSGVLCALAVVTLSLTLIIPSGSITFAGAAIFMVHLNTDINGTRHGLISYVVILLICLMLMTSRPDSVIAFAAFGHYPVERYYINRMGSKAVRWIFKFAIYNGIIVLLYLIATQFFKFTENLYIMFLLLQVTLVAYDRALDVALLEVKKRIKLFNV